MTQWRQTDDGMWQYRGEDGYWYLGDGPNSTPADISPPVEENSAVPAESQLVAETPQQPEAPIPAEDAPTGTSAVSPPSILARVWQGPKKWWIIGGVALVVLAGAGVGIAAATSGGGQVAGTVSTQSTDAASAPFETSTAAPFETTTTTTVPVPTDTNLPVGTAALITKDGQPYYSVTMTQFVNPAQPANSYVTPQNAGDIYVAAAFTITNQSSAAISDDINLDARIYDSAGQGFEPDFEETASGPSFPSGEINVAPGGTASGWVMFEVPGSTSLTTVNFTPSAGYATQATASWKVG